jgi:hypothetical protein
MEAKVVMYFFKSLSFEYGGMSSLPTTYNYLKAKDIIKWNNLSPKKYIPLIDLMFNSYVSNLPKPKTKK